jgi:large subunit ribosomal protein L4
MTILPVYNIVNQKVSDIELEDSIFAGEIEPSLFYDVVRRQLASERKGTAATKNKALVRGGGAKPWRQKGTGKARAGSRRSPLWKGGEDFRPYAPTILQPSPKSEKGRSGLLSHETRWKLT